MHIYQIYRCKRCGFIYNEELGLPNEGIPAKTKWQNIPDTWVCPDCGMKKSIFKMVIIKQSS